jgi:hypothetical protein
VLEAHEHVLDDGIAEEENDVSDGRQQEEQLESSLLP